MISGTSAGAINAAFLACNADQFDQAMENLIAVWSDFKVEQVYRSDVLGMIRSGARWLSLLSLGWLITQKKLRPKSLLNNDPLSELLQEHIDLSRLVLDTHEELPQGKPQRIAPANALYSEVHLCGTRGSHDPGIPRVLCGLPDEQFRLSEI